MNARRRRTRPLKVQPKALVVDDDPVWQSTFARYLTDAGLVAARASSKEEADDLLRREFFHVALVDMSLVADDNRDGLQVLRKIYGELAEGTAGILLTAYGSPEEGAEATNLGAFQVFNKRRLDYAIVIETIRQGLAAATEALARYHVGLNLLAGSGISEDKQLHETHIVSTLGRAADIVDRLAGSLVRGLYPALRLARSPVAVIDASRKVVSGTYWSKMLGAPFFLVMGATSIVEEDLESFERHPDEYAAGTLSDVLRVERHGDLAGVVFQATSPAVEAFDHRPDMSFRPRRTGSARK